MRLSCEVTLNLTENPETLELMQRTGFTRIFCGLETPEIKALTANKKRQNLLSPILESVRTLNRHGMEISLQDY